MTWCWLEIGEFVANLILIYSNVIYSFQRLLLNDVQMHTTSFPWLLDKNLLKISFVQMKVPSTFSQHTGRMDGDIMECGPGSIANSSKELGMLMIFEFVYT
jgi:hypothetical protein